MLTFGQIGLSAMVISVIVMGGVLRSQSDNAEKDRDTMLYLAVTFVLYWLGAVMFKDTLPSMPLKGYLIWSLFAEFALTIASAYILGFIFKLVGTRRSGLQGGK